MRNYMDENQFIEIETPVLTKSTPEGARDYLVPSRIHEHHFYALPQSPQLFKQLLMVSGFDRYFLIVKCFRDEDLRPNRQPEFTQVDLEASFIDEQYIYNLIEKLIVGLYQINGKAITAPFKQLDYNQAMNKYGNDHPDLRFDLSFTDVTHVFINTEYKIFKGVVGGGGVIKGINLKGQSLALSKNVMQDEICKTIIPQLGGKGLTWMRVEEGRLNSNVVQFFSEEEQSNLLQAMNAEEHDMLVFVADNPLEKVNEVLGRFRLYIAERLGLIDQEVVAPCWVVDFPLFECKDGKFSTMHHPFTRPAQDILNLSTSELLQVKAKAYDLVINGEEVGGGSLRIYDKKVQQKVFKVLGFEQKEIDEKFGFFMRAFDYGMPPHGGIALGLDRLISMIFNTNSIRDVIAFPKNRVAVCPLTQAPSEVQVTQLKELHIQKQKNLD